MNTFLTQDFYLASFLMASNYRILDYYRKAGFTTFVFEETPQLKDYVNNFYAEKTLIEPVKHGRAIKALKSMIHSINSSLSTSNLELNNGSNNKSKGI
ncbi:MAG: DUF5659 domain-containing protein [Ignavibacteriales bacterium]|nr:DUF5659 domain-containing protein [Ignavibacteriales bacterium]